MPDISKEQQDQLEQDMGYMRQAKMSEEDIDAYMHERLRGWNITLPGSDVTPQTALRVTSMMGGAAGGGLALPNIARAISPKLAGPVLSPMLAGAGEATGQFLGDIFTGGEPVQAAKGALVTGGLGAGANLVGNAATYATGRMGGVPGETLRETISRGPVGGSELARPFPLPKVPKRAGLDLAYELKNQLYPAEPAIGDVNLAAKTPARNRAETAIRRFDQANPPAHGPYDALSNTLPARTAVPQVPEFEQEPPGPYNSSSPPSQTRTRQASAVVPTERDVITGRTTPPTNQYDLGGQAETKTIPITVTEFFPRAGQAPGTYSIPPTIARQSSAGGVDTEPIRQKLVSMIRPRTQEAGQQRVNEYLREKIANLPDRMTMRDLDAFITEHTAPLAKKIGVEQVDLPSKVKLGMVGAARNLRNKLLPEARASFDTASKQLDSMRAVAKKMLTPKKAVKEGAESTFRDFLNNQRTQEIFEEYEKVTGHKIVQSIKDLAMKAHWSGEERRIAGYKWSLAEGFFARGAAKYGVALTEPASVGVAAASAFNQAMSGKPRKQALETTP